MQKKSLTIKNLCPGLVERGKIKIGIKGEWRKTERSEFQLPVKLDHFIVTTLQRGDDNNFIQDEQLHKILGAEPKEIPIRLLYDSIELNFQSRYSCYVGKKIWCSGDGESADRFKNEVETDDVPCPCERQNPRYQKPDRCKINGVLSVIIDGAEVVGGVWKLRTKGYNSVVGIMSSLALIKSITGGPLAGIPLRLTIQPKTVANPLDGKSQTIFVVGVEFRGTVSALRETGFNLALEYKTYDVKMDHIESEALKLLSYDNNDFHETDTVPEFYQDQEAPAPALVEPGAAPATGEGPAPAADPAPAASPVPDKTSPAAAASPARRGRRPAGAPAPSAPLAPAAAPNPAPEAKDAHAPAPAAAAPAAKAAPAAAPAKKDLNLF